MSTESVTDSIPDRFDVALSVAGPQRHLAADLASRLKKAGFEVFYDENYKSDLWGEDLAAVFQQIFGERSRYCVIFKSREYAERMWTNFERQNAVARAIKERGKAYILPVEIDSVDLPGIPTTISHISMKDSSIEEISGLLIGKLTATHPQVGAENNPATVSESKGSSDEPEQKLKDYLTNPYHNRIEIDHLVMGEIQRALSGLQGRSLLSTRPAGSQVSLDDLPLFADTASPLVRLFAMGCTWGDAEQTNTWRKALTKVFNASSARLTYMPDPDLVTLLVSVLLYTGGISALLADRYELLSALLRLEVSNDQRGHLPLSALAGEINVAFNRVLPSTEQWKTHYQPFSEQMHAILREPLDDVTVDDVTYDNTFDQFEFLLALLYADATFERTDLRDSWVPTGRFLWRNRHDENHDVALQIERQASGGQTWPILKFGLFGGDPDRLQKCLEHVNSRVVAFRSQMM
jgi:TIR domain